MSHALVLLIGLPMVAVGQEPSDNPDAGQGGYSGCLDSDGSFYGMSAGRKQVSCQANDVPVFLGSSTIAYVEGGNGINVADLGDGIKLELDPNVVLPPSCSPGEKVVASPTGWECLRESAVGKPGQVWIQPLWVTFRRSSSNTDPRVGAPHLRLVEGELAFVNPGSAPTNVSCYFFSADGVLQLDFTTTVTVGRGEMGRCRLALSPDASPLWGWSLLVADSGIWPSGRAWDRDMHVHYAFGAERSLPLYRVDCDDPTGQEFVCQFAGQ